MVIVGSIGIWDIIQIEISDKGDKRELTETNRNSLES
jgi:hypothetical protein